MDYKIKISCYIMKLKVPQEIPILPLSLLCNPSDLEPQQQYLTHLKNSLSDVLVNLQANVQQHHQRYIKRQQIQEIIEEKQQSIAQLMHQNKCLQRENNELKFKVDNYQRGLKRYAINEDLLNNKIYHLNRLIAEKEAIIKYLEEKAENMPKYAMKPLGGNDSVQDNFNKTFTKGNISFAKLRTAKSIKFEDFSNLSMQVEENQEPPFVRPLRGRADRIKTESSTKENQKLENISGMTNFNDFFNSRGKVDSKTNLISSMQNQRTLTKSHISQQNGLIWQIPSKPKQANEVPIRRHSNMNSSKCLSQLTSKDYLLRE